MRRSSRLILQLMLTKWQWLVCRPLHGLVRCLHLLPPPVSACGRQCPRSSNGRPRVLPLSTYQGAHSAPSDLLGHLPATSHGQNPLKRSGAISVCAGCYCARATLAAIACRARRALAKA